MIPLAERLRPQSLSDYIGQKALLGENAPLRRAIEAGRIPSMILWGPPGVGKTTLASVIASSVDRPFKAISAINSGVKEIREVIDEAKRTGLFQKSTILFIDEIHRFSKSQQDALLGAVEKGWITLIGATTENPSFEVNHALLSRCQVYVLENHTREDLESLIHRAIQTDEIIKAKSVLIKETEALIRYSGGDARKLLNILELVVDHLPQPPVLNNADVEKWANANAAHYDKNGEQHYDIISAFIKSIRGSDPDAAVYYMARMIVGGEDPMFIARRMMILAAEDIGLANPNALLIAQATAYIVHQIGMPEARIPLSECAIYLATSPKSNSAYLAIDAAIAKVHETGDLPVPIHLRNAPTKLMKELGYGQQYQYAHSFANHFILQDYLPSEVRTEKFYQAAHNSKEQSIDQWMQQLWGDFKNK
jgi:putative ATPase